MSASTLRYTTWLLATLIGFPVLWGQPATYVVTTICLVFGFTLAHGVESGSRRAVPFALLVTGGWLLASTLVIVSMDAWGPWLIDRALPVLGGDGRHEGLFIAAVVSVLMLGMGGLVAALEHRMVGLLRMPAIPSRAPAWLALFFCLWLLAAIPNFQGGSPDIGTDQFAGLIAGAAFLWMQHCSCKKRKEIPS